MLEITNHRFINQYYNIYNKVRELISNPINYNSLKTKYIIYIQLKMSENFSRSLKQSIFFLILECEYENSIYKTKTFQYYKN